MYAACLICVVRARDDLEKLLKRLKSESTRVSAAQNRPGPSNGAKADIGVQPEPSVTMKATPECLPGPPPHPEDASTAKRQREEIEEGECVAWGDEDVGEPCTKKAREDMWVPPAIDQPVDDAWRPQAPPPPPSHPGTPRSSELPAGGLSEASIPGDHVRYGHEDDLAHRPELQRFGNSAKSVPSQADDELICSQSRNADSGDESLEEGEVRE
jgi:hypothetical protein